MLSRLAPCARCQRHIRNTEASCPFCGTERSSLRTHATALLAGVALLTGCGAPEEKPKPTTSEVKTDSQPADSKPVVEEPDVPREMYGAPPPPATDPVAPTTAPAATAPATMSTNPEVKPKPPAKRPTKDPEPQRKLYGAPPPRDPKSDPLGPL
jgi:hypothetical protein